MERQNELLAETLAMSLRKTELIHKVRLPLQVWFKNNIVDCDPRIIYTAAKICQYFLIHQNRFPRKLEVQQASEKSLHVFITS